MGSKEEGTTSTQESGGETNTDPNRRRVLKASAAIAAGSGIVGPVKADHDTGGTQNDECSGSLQCEAKVTFNDQTVGSACGTCSDSVNVAKAVFPASDPLGVEDCGGGFVDIHDDETDTGPSGSFGGGYPLGATTWFPTGTHTDICIALFCGNENGKFGSCVSWTREQLTSTRDMRAMLHLDTNNSKTFEHYCQHESAIAGIDHAYLCDNSPPPTQDKATIHPD